MGERVVSSEWVPAYEMRGQGGWGISEKHKPLKAQRCQNCVYAVTAAGKGKAVLVCTNKEHAKGQLFLAEAKGSCRNFQGKRLQPNRPKVEQPKDGQIRFIPLTQGKVAIVDKEDYEELSRYKWHASSRVESCYAYRRKGKRSLSMHREIMGEPKGMVVDHIDGNGLNNRRRNLRVCTSSQNHQNRRRTRGRSRYKGVCWEKRRNKWRAEIMLEGRHIDIGCFADEVEAARAYDKKAKELFGEFAYLNFANFTAESAESF